MPSLPALGSLDPLALVGAVVGLVWGFAADRIGARWPAHDDGSVRPIDWRTVVVALFGAVALAAVPGRFEDPATRALFWAYFAAFVLLMATDLDQRLLPDVVTLPLIAVAVLAVLFGIDPHVAGRPLYPILGAIVVPVVMFVLSVPFGSGALGIGDVKLLIGVGILGGILRSFIGVVVAALLGGVVIVALLLGRRVTLKSYIPFGPFLIAGALWALLLPASGG